MKSLPIYYIEWSDSQTTMTGWCRDDDIEDPVALYVRTVGFIVKENDEAILIAQNDGRNQFSHLLTIPKSAIRVRRILRLAKARERK